MIFYIKKGKPELRRLVFLFSLFLLLSSIPYPASAVNSIPVRIFEGTEDAKAIFANLDYNDVRQSNSWAKDAIWETGALELMKGYGEKRFGLNERLSVEESLVIAYNMAGREAEAQLAAEALDLQRQEEDRKTPAERMWADGYIQLALNDGLITQEQYNDAMQTDRLEPPAFNRYGPVTREDMAFYFAKVLGINPVNSQTHIFNGYRDWSDANPHRIPYIEALLQNRVMSGSGNGYFRPKGNVTREQAAQVIQNAAPFIFPKHNIEKFKGTIESINQYTDRTGGHNSTVTVVDVRNSSGQLHQFRFESPSAEGTVNEMAGGSKNIVSKGAIVNDMGVLKDESAFSEGQEIIYIVKNTRIYYASIVTNSTKTEYYLGKILSVDELNRHIGSEILLELPFPDIRLIEPAVLYNIVPYGAVEILSVSEDANIYIDFSLKTLKDIKPESIMFITVDNGLVTGLEQVNLDLMQEEGIVSGIIEENNPALGYVTLYFPDGLGTSPAYRESLSNYRSYSYLRAENVTVFKNGLPAIIDDINPGDSVFIKLDDDGNLIRISASDNYYPVYGRVRAKLIGNLLVEKQDGTYEQIAIPPQTPIFRQKRRVSWDDIKEGDSVRILLQKSGSNVIIGEVTLEKKVQETTGIYRAQLGYYDELNNSLVVTRLQQFSDGIWRQPQTAGASKLQISENYKPDIQKGLQGTIYLAVGKNLMGNNTVIKMASDGGALLSEVIGDTIVEVQPGRGSLTLLNKNARFVYGPDSIIVKGGKLLEPNQVKSYDEAYVVAGSHTDGTQKANIIWLKEPAEDTGFTLYRGRISGIEWLSSVTLQSFSEFRDPEWEFVNVPKTLSIDPQIIRIYDDDGRTDPAQFDDTGENNYKNRTVYVLAQEGRAMLVSTAPYGDVVYKGRILRLEGAVKDSYGHFISPPSSMIISEARVYNLRTWIWENRDNT
ncbi:MAG TPA: S-layer homology domain-containing protein, partial [Clostridia bacterium]